MFIPGTTRGPKHTVRAGRCRSSPELFERDRLVLADVKRETFRYYLLEEFAQTFEHRHNNQDTVPFFKVRLTA